jgi:hypothetical protein
MHVLCAEHHIPMWWDGEAQLYRCWEWQRSGCDVTHDPAAKGDQWKTTAPRGLR